MIQTCGKFVTANHILEEKSYGMAMSLQNNKLFLFKIN